MKSAVYHSTQRGKRERFRKLLVFVLAFFLVIGMNGCTKVPSSNTTGQTPVPTAGAEPIVKAGADIFIDGEKLGITIPEGVSSLNVPADIIYPALGAAYEYDESAEIASIQFGPQAFEIPVGCDDFTVNGRVIVAESQPYVSGGSLMVPLRTAVESVGGGVKWVGSQNAWQVYSRSHLEDTVDIMGDGTPLKTKLAQYERYFGDDEYVFWSALRDGASIYRSDSDGHVDRLLRAATEIIGMAGDRIFFINITEDNHLYSMEKDGTGLKQLVPGPVFGAAVSGDIIRYYSLENGLSACSVKADGTGNQILNDEITVMEGDWDIRENTDLTGKTILLKGNLTVRSGCTLTLEDTRLVFDTGNEGEAERRFDVDKASIVIKNSDIRSTGQNFGILFTARESAVTIEDSRISNIWENIVLDHCDEARCAGNYVVDGGGSGFISSDRTIGAVYEDNIIINKNRDQMPWMTFSCSFSSDLIIRNNVCVSQGECIFFQQGSSGLVSGNLILGDRYWLGLSLRHDAANTTYDNNFLQYNYDNGYRISGWDSSNGLNSDSLDSTGTFSRNVINNATDGMRIHSLKNCIYDSNRVWLQLFDPFEGRMGAVGVSMQYSHHCELINNTLESWNGGSGAQLFYCSENRFEGNTFSGFTYGIECWNKSDGNMINGNGLIDCGSSILLNGSSGNTVKDNAVISTKGNAINVYNEGDNVWDSNYYSDWQKPEPRKISDTVSDSTPLTAEPPFREAELEYTPVPYDYAAESNESNRNQGNGYIADERLWKDETVNYTWNRFEIASGGCLTLENAIWVSPSMYNSEPEIRIFDGGKLIMKNSRIVADPEGMSFYFGVDSGGTLIVENCIFENIHDITIHDGANVTFDHCTFTDCYEALTVYGSPEIVIQNCTVNNSFSGIRGFDYGSFGNTQTNVALEFMQP